MLEKYLSKEQVMLGIQVKNPEEAIRTAGDLLVKSNKAEAAYVDAMIDSFHRLGSYIVIAPSIAMPHARPSELVKEPCLSFLQLKKPIKFNHPQNDPVHLIFALGGNNAENHIEMLKALSSVLMDSKRVEGLKKAKSYEEVLSIVSKGNV